MALITKLTKWTRVATGTAPTVTIPAGSSRLLIIVDEQGTATFGSLSPTTANSWIKYFTEAQIATLGASATLDCTNSAILFYAFFSNIDQLNPVDQIGTSGNPMSVPYSAAAGHRLLVAAVNNVTLSSSISNYFWTASAGASPLLTELGFGERRTVLGDSFNGNRRTEIVEESVNIDGTVLGESQAASGTIAVSNGSSSGGERLVIFNAAPPAVLFETTVAAASTITASLNVSPAVFFESTITAVSTVTSALDVSKIVEYVTSVSIQSAVTASLRVDPAFAATVTAVSDVNANLVRAVTFGSTTSVVSAVTAAMLVVTNFAATVNAVSTVTGSMRKDRVAFGIVTTPPVDSLCTRVAFNTAESLLVASTNGGGTESDSVIEHDIIDGAFTRATNEVTASGAINGVDFSADDTKFIYLTTTGPNLHLFDTTTWVEPSPYPVNPSSTSSGQGVAFSNDGTMIAIAAGSGGGKLVVYDAVTGIEISSLPTVPDDAGSHLAVAFSPDSSLLCVTHQTTVDDRTGFHLYNTSDFSLVSGQPTLIVPTFGGNTTTDCHFSPDGQFLVIGHSISSPFYTMYNVSDFSLVTGLPASNNSTQRVRFDNNSELLAIGSSNATHLRILDLATKTFLTGIPTIGAQVRGLDFSTNFLAIAHSEINDNGLTVLEIGRLLGASPTPATDAEEIPDVIAVAGAFMETTVDAEEIPPVFARVVFNIATIDDAEELPDIQPNERVSLAPVLDAEEVPDLQPSEGVNLAVVNDAEEIPVVVGLDLKRFVSTTNVVSTVVSGFEVARPLQTTITAQSDVVSLLEIGRPLETTVAAQSDVVSSLVRAVMFEATVNAVSDVIASFETGFVATVTAQSSVTANLIVSRAMSTTVAAQSDVTPNLVRAIDYTSVTNVASALFSTLERNVRFSTQVNAVTDVVADFSLAAQFSCTVSAVSTVSASLARGVAYSAVVPANVTVFANIIEGLRFMSAVVVESAVITANLVRDVPFQSTTNVVSNVIVSDFDRAVAFSASLAVFSTVTGTLVVITNTLELTLSEGPFFQEVADRVLQLTFTSEDSVAIITETDEVTAVTTEFLPDVIVPDTTDN